MESNGDFISPVIAQIATKGKFGELVDNLSPAPPENYASIHNGGKKGFKSTIGVSITDYAASPTVQVTAHVAPETISYILRMGFESTTQSAKDLPSAQGADVSANLKQFMANPLPAELCIKGAGRCYAVPQGLLMEIREKGDATVKQLLAPVDSVPPLPDNGQGVWLPVPESVLRDVLKARNGNNDGAADFSYKQERVNVYKREGDMAPVTQLQITRNRMVNGEVRRLPWTITISQFRAKIKEHPNGTVSYIPGTVVGQVKESISASDQDMFAFLLKGERYIRVWEMTFGPEILRQGIAARNAQRTKNSGNY